MVNYKLHYFDLRANGENARQIFAYAGKEYEDFRQPMDTWYDVKKSTPFGQLPLLFVDGKVLAQSNAISRYLARQFGLSGKNAWEEAQVDSLADQFKDYQTEVRPYNMIKMEFVTEDPEKPFKELFLPSFKKNYQFFTNFLKANGTGFFVGDSPTWVDFLIAEHTADLLATKNSVLSVDHSLLDEFPEMKAHQKKVHELPNIKKWLQERPVTKF